MEKILRFRLSEDNVVGFTLCPYCTEDMREEILESWAAIGFDRIAPFRVQCPHCCRMYRLYPAVIMSIEEREELPEEHCRPEHPDDCIGCPRTKGHLERYADRVLRYRREDKDAD